MASGTANDEVRILSPSESGSAQTGSASNVNRIDRFIQKGEEILETFVSSIRSFEGQALKIKDLATSVSEIQANLKRNNDESGQNEPSKRRKVSHTVSNSDSSDSDSDGDIDGLMNEPGPSHHTEDSEGPLTDDVLMGLDNFFVEEEETGPAINETVAKVVNKSLRPNKIDKEKIQALHQKYKRPANVETLQVPKIDKFLWNQLETNVKSTDISKQHIIDDFNKAAAPLVAAMDHAYANDQPDLSFLKECIGDSFKSICSTIAKINSQRRDSIRKEVDHSFKSLCASETNTSATGLFGDKLQEQSKNAESCRQIKMINKGHFLGKGGGGGKSQLPLYRSTQRPQPPET
ncbi:uncharacterized protein LOC132755346 [Ruditapes philippinarum]|uniref:uncharacterized protein LOC132755346 n=1 Tax=Ruditapes philippinarum TaxID=129788 RepID=UPI00295B9C75|nr:uncharacterized protein LOC132755346 [Ruditapes philippinarum]